MKKIILIIVLSLVAIAGVFLAIGIANGKEEEIINTYEIEDFSSFEINISTSNLEFIPTNERGKVICHETEKLCHKVSVNDDTLHITSNLEENKKWYEFISFGGVQKKVEIYIPVKNYGTLNIYASTGNIKIPADFEFENVFIILSTGNVEMASKVINEIKITTSTGNQNLNNISATHVVLDASTGNININNLNATKDIRINSSTGDIIASNIIGENLTIEASTAKVNLTNVVISNHMRIETSTGDITLTDCDSLTAEIKASTGNISGNFLTYHKYEVSTSTGKINIPESHNDAGLYILKTSTGNITISGK